MVRNKDPIEPLNKYGVNELQCRGFYAAYIGKTYTSFCKRITSKEQIYALC